MSESADVTPMMGVWKSGLIDGMVATVEQRSGALSAVVQLHGRAVAYFDAPTLDDLLRLIEKHRGPGRYEGPTFLISPENTVQPKSTTRTPADQPPCSEPSLSEETLSQLLTD